MENESEMGVKKYTLFKCLKYPKRGLEFVVEWWFVIPAVRLDPRDEEREGKEGGQQHH